MTMQHNASRFTGASRKHATKGSSWSLAGTASWLPKARSFGAANLEGLSGDQERHNGQKSIGGDGLVEVGGCAKSPCMIGDV